MVTKRKYVTKVCLASYVIATILGPKAFSEAGFKAAGRVLAVNEVFSSVMTLCHRSDVSCFNPPERCWQYSVITYESSATDVSISAPFWCQEHNFAKCHFQMAKFDLRATDREVRN